MEKMDKKLFKGLENEEDNYEKRWGYIDRALSQARPQVDPILEKMVHPGIYKGIERKI